MPTQIASGPTPLSVAPPPTASLLGALASVEDRRRPQGRRYPLAPFLAFLCAATLAGRKGYRAILEWGEDIASDLLQALGLRRSPSLGTLSRVLSGLDVASFERALGAWIERVRPPHAAGPRCLALDGKTLRGSQSGGIPGVHLLAVFEPAIGCVLAQSAVDRKTNEHKAALELIRSLVLDGRLVTGDAAFAQKDVCHAILDGGGDYLLAVKANQPQLLDDCPAAFLPPDSPSGPEAPGGDRLGGRVGRQGARAPRAAKGRGHLSPQPLPRPRMARSGLGPPDHARGDPRDEAHAGGRLRHR